MTSGISFHKHGFHRARVDTAVEQAIPSFTDGCNTEAVPRVAGNVREADKGRIALISARAAQLFDRYDMILGRIIKNLR